MTCLISYLVSCQHLSKRRSPNSCPHSSQHPSPHSGLNVPHVVKHQPSHLHAHKWFRRRPWKFPLHPRAHCTTCAPRGIHVLYCYGLQRPSRHFRAWKMPTTCVPWCRAPWEWNHGRPQDRVRHQMDPHAWSHESVDDQACPWPPKSPRQLFQSKPARLAEECWQRFHHAAISWS